MASNVRREVITREYYPDMTGGQMPTQGQMPMRQVAAQGQRGDTELAHVNRWEQELLKKLGGAGTRNPLTGLKQFYTFYGQMSPEQKDLISSYYNNPNIRTYNPDYTEDIYGGIQSGKYSYEDAINAFQTLAQQAGMQSKNPPNELQPIPIPGGGEEGGGGEGGGEEGGGGAGENFFNFPTDIMPKSTSGGETYSGLPPGYRDQLLGTLMPQLNQAIAMMPQNIDKYVQEALSSYEAMRQNNLRTNIPKAIANLANRGIINSTEGQKVLGNVYASSAEEASTKGYNTAMQAALLKANMPNVLGDIAKLGQYSSGKTQSESSDPTEMYRIMASLLTAQF